jgi:DNA replication initiation complex subunit (GINS family)
MAPMEPLSYDEIHSIQRKERSTRSLAKVPPEFYPRLSAYLAQARRELEAESSKGAGPRVLLLQGQFRNLEETAREIVMLRLRKVSEMSFTAVEGGSLNDKLLTPEERDFATALAQMVRTTGRGALAEVPFEGPPDAAGPRAERSSALQAVRPEPQAPPAPPPPVPAPPAPAPFEPMASQVAAAAPEHSAHALLRILDDIPPFEGENHHVYRLRKEDVVTLPRDIASILVRRKKAVEMEAPA